MTDLKLRSRYPSNPGYETNLNRFSRIRSWTGWLTIVLILLSGLTVPAAAQAPQIGSTGVVNGAKFTPSDFPGSALAPGALITIMGVNLGPVNPVAAGSLPLPTILGGTEVVVNDTASCAMIYASAQQVNCQLPSNLNGGQIRLLLRTHDQDQIRESAPFTAALVSANFGFFTMNGNGRGPGAALNFISGGQYQQNGARATARPGQVMLMYGTGLGATDPPVAAGQASSGLAPAVIQPDVYVGGIAAQVQYAGRAPGFAGVDQIQFVVPPNVPAGCSVPVRLRSQDRIHNQSFDSNIATIAVHATGQTCVDAVETIAQGSHGTVVLASGLGHLGSGQTGNGGSQGNGAGGPGGNPGAGNGGSGGGNGSGSGSGSGAGPVGFGPHPGILPHAFGYGFQSGRGNGSDVIVARFVASGGFADIGVPPVATNSCNVYYQGPRANPDLFLGAAQFLDAGTLTLTTRTGSTVQVTPDTISGSGVLYEAPLPEVLGAGNYSVAAAGGADVGAFGPVSLGVPTLISVTSNFADGTTFSRSTPLQVAWTGGGSSDMVLIYGRSYKLGTGVQPPVSDPGQFRSMAFVCSTTASAGQFAVPVDVLQQLPTGQLSLTVSHMPSQSGVSRFSAPGLTLGGVFRWLSTVTYPNLVLGQ
jgi:uncharacterized protein (TIGR03437 family)